MSVESEPMDERSERIAQRFEWPMVIAALLVIPVIWIEAAEPGEPLWYAVARRRTARNGT